MIADRALEVRDLGRIAFPEAHRLQLELVQQRHAGACPDTLLLCEHDSVITLGRATGEKWLRDGEVRRGRIRVAAAQQPHEVSGPVVPSPSAAGDGSEVGRGRIRVAAAQQPHEVPCPAVPIHRIERGGEATFHGPGQLVAYPILDLRDHGRDIHRFIRSLEEVVLRVLTDFGLAGERREGLTGVWVHGAKIAAIGVAIRRWISFHGVALNLDCDLSVYDEIIPCGLPEARTTSMARELGAPVGMDAAKACLAGHLAQVFGLTPAELLTAR
jgi:lipoate-protein ligase B